MSIPKNSVISRYTDNAYFYDSYSTIIRYENQSALDVYLLIAKSIPDWVNWLMSLRNQIVSKFGLKNLGKMAGFDFNKSSDDYKEGDRIGIFTIFANTKHEVILEDHDKHLDVKISFLIEPDGDKATVHASTVVHIKNTFGKVYMFFVAPIHKVIVPTSLKALPHKNNRERQ